MGWIVVTGATGGIGRVLVERLIAGNLNVIAAVRAPNLMTKQVVSPKGQIAAVSLDLQSEDSIRACAGGIENIVGGEGVAGLVNLAGAIVEGPLEALPPRSFVYQLQVNVVGPFALTQALLPSLKAARGRVVNVGAISAHLTVPFYGPIAASKSALASLNDAMRMEFAPLGIRVLLVEPGAMRTSIFATARKLRDDMLSANTQVEERYRAALTAMDNAFERAGADKPEVTVEAIMQALTARTPKARVVVGKGTRSLLLMAKLPIRLRDRLIKNALHLDKALRSS
jgi:NAD(P)-dependent dehydrogenase (short-subunit alcohol dehydrogenase family)